MKSIRMLAMLFAAGSLMLAACEPQPRTTEEDVRADEPAVHAPLTAGDLIGHQVENRQGETLGTVDDIAVDLETGRMTYALVSTGGVLGVGATHRAVPVEALEIHHRRDPMHQPGTMDMDRQEETQPGQQPTTRQRQPATGDAGQTMTPGQTGQRMDTRGQDEITILLDMTQEQWEQQGEITRDDFFRQDVEVHRETHTAFGRQWRTDVDAARMVWATDLRGANVVTHADERTGTIDEIVVNVEDARVPFVVISTGGILDTEDDRYLVPTNMLTYDREQDRVLFAGDPNMFRDARDMRQEDWDQARRAETRDIYVFRDFDGRTPGTWDTQQRRQESPYN